MGKLPACRDEDRKAKTQLELNPRMPKTRKAFLSTQVTKERGGNHEGLGLNEAGNPRNQGKVWSKEDSPLVEEDEVREHCRDQDMHKSRDQEGMSGLMSHQGHSLLSLTSPGPKTEGKQMSPLS